MRRFLTLWLMLVAFASPAWPQTSPNWTRGYVPQPSEWNSLWSSKQDVAATATGAATARTLADRSADTINALDGTGGTAGMKCDGSTNDGPSLAALIAAAQTANKLLQLPSGVCIIDATTASIVITAPITIRGRGMYATYLRLKSGSTHPALTVNVTTTTFSPGSGEPAQVEIDDLQFDSPDRTNAAGLGVAHALMLINNAAHYHATRVYLNNLLLGGVPGDGIHCGGTQDGGTGGFDGWVEAHGVIGQYTGGVVYFANSCTDGRWFGGEIAGAGGTNNGLLLSGTMAMVFDGVNFYSNGGYDVELYQADNTVISNSTLDLTSYSTLRVTLLAGQSVDVIGTLIRWGSSQANGFYGDINIDVGNAGNVYLTAVKFATPASSASVNKPKSNINFIAGSGGAVYVDGNTSFDLGTLATTGVVTGTGTIIGQGPGTMAGYTVATLRTCGAAMANVTAYVTDATAPTYNGALTGGGSVKVPVFCNGSAWVSH